MFYLKTEIDGKLRNIHIYDDEIYTVCFVCQKEFQVDAELIRWMLEDGEFASTQMSCGKCDPNLRKQFEVICGGKIRNEY